MEGQFANLDTPARHALDIAMGAAAAIGDRQCGTEYLLYGLFAGRLGEISELADLFVLDALRIERAIQKVREPFTSISGDYDGDPPLSVRAQAALRTPRYDGTGPTGVFEILFGVLHDPRSGACAVLRELGVRPEEVHRLADYGRRHLTKEEAAALLAVLDRREARRHRPWWGPFDEGRLVPCQMNRADSLAVGRSTSAVATAGQLAADDSGFMITLAVESCRPWVLPPVVDPPEILVPGSSARRRLGPEMLRFELVFADGARVSNASGTERWRPERPNGPSLVLLDTRVETYVPNDRRAFEQRRVIARWWVSPLPAPGTVELRVDWPAEVLSGVAAFDARPMLQRVGAA